MAIDRAISIIIPTWNESANITNIIREIADVANQNNLTYEIIFVDDHSTDNSAELINSNIANYPITLVSKVGKKGKATALMQGFNFARYPYIASLDADLQYSPRTIPAMLNGLEAGLDMVIAEKHKGDIYSGLKVFRREIIERFVLHPQSWALDLELVKKTIEAGYVIGTIPAIWQPRPKDQRRAPKFGRNLELFLNSAWLNLKRKEIHFFNKRLIEEKGHGFHYKGATFVSHTKLPHDESAFHRLSKPQISVLLAVLGFFIISMTLNAHATAIIGIAILTVLYFGDLIFNLYLIYRSFAKPTEISITKDLILKEPDENWPIYTVLCPLYKESQVIPQFVNAMSRMDYPKDRLQVLLLLEEDDTQTIEAAKNQKLPEFIQIVIVPDAHPKTKPKASNYGLRFAKGKYTTIYDAEDVPDPLQLKKSVLAFKNLGPEVVCVQAKLNFYNPKQNLLTRIFTAEYSLWFDLVLTGLHSIGAPIPLGGTSNHFPTEKLRELHGWDSFNVTEDCDLGMRLVKRHYKTAVIDSVTFEEANSSLMNWMLQRTRWIKGYIQTYLVHMRNPLDFHKSWREPHFITFQVIVGGKILSMIINPLMWVITISYFVFRSTFGAWVEQFYPAPILYMAVFSLIFGNFLYMYYYMIGCAKRDYDDLMKYVFFVPLYWLGMSIAAWRAIGEMFFQPHYWSKTKHGLHLNNKRAMEHASNVVGYKLGGNS